MAVAVEGEVDEDEKTQVATVAAVAAAAANDAPTCKREDRGRGRVQWKKLHKLKQLELPEAGAITSTTPDTPATVSTSASPEPAQDQPNEAVTALAATARTSTRRRPPRYESMIALPTSLPSKAQSARRILVASIGNPAPYTHTLHSAGHTVLHALRVQLSFPPLAPTPRRSGADGGLRTSTPDSPITLWQSRSLMNDSGRGVKAAWEHYRRENHASLPFSTATRHNDELNNGEDEEGEEQIMLVVLHDELEAPLGKIKVRRPASGKKGGGGGGSARGHNGLKSILAGLPDLRFTRIGVGIGRPTSRDPDDVARYVLRKMTAAEKETLEGPVAGLVLQALRGLLK